ncbi:MAG TPA: alpha/beta fold hydrolase [Thermomicrobiales bacterium]|nr:alpha/beta fold hydrolase [Thermomicrobiales bacterium]
MSDRDNDLGAPGAADATDAAPTTDEKAPEMASESKSKPKRPRRSTEKAARAKAESAKEESLEMVSEGGPVGDEADRQLGVTELPAEIVEKETRELEKSHPELVEGAAPTKAPKTGDKPNATIASAVAAKPASSRKKPATKKSKDAATPLSSSDPLLPGAGNPSPDGTQLAYLLTEAGGSTRLWITALDGSSASSIELPFRPVFDPEGPQWAPDGTSIALAGSAPSEIGTAIWLAPVDGGECVLLADHAASDEQPRWSPDGSLLAFASKRHGRSAICVATPDGYGPVVQLTAGPIGQDDRNPCWEPNSQRIAFTRHMVDGDNEGEQIWTVSILTGELKQATKKLAHRSQLQWCPGKSQIAFITDEAEWLNVGVVNPDNSAGWNLASEAGDKASPRYSPDGNRIMYTRRVRGEVRLVERPTSGATADPLDPGAGVAASPRWLPDKRVVYEFSSAKDAPSFVVQEAKKDVARLFIPIAGGWEAQDWFVSPDHTDYEIAGGLKAGALVYRTKSDDKQPAVLLLGATPHSGHTYGYDSTIQALVQRGFTVIVATLPGTPGYGKKIVNAFKERAGTEAEISDLVDLANWARGLDYVDRERVYLVGEGYGGALALLLPGARPGAVDAVAVIDPVTDWDDELDQADDEFAYWYLTALGLPSTNRGRSALRTPTTFAGVLDLPVLLVGTSRANLGRAVQLERFAAALDELGVPYRRETAENESTWQTAERVATFLDAPATPEQAVEPAEAAPAEPTEPGFVIEPVETVDIEALRIGSANGGSHEDALDAASTDELRVVEDVAAEQVPEDLPEPGSPAEVVAESAELDPEYRIIPPKPELPLTSSNVGRGMRTDEI